MLNNEEKLDIMWEIVCDLRIKLDAMTELKNLNQHAYHRERSNLENVEEKLQKSREEADALQIELTKTKVELMALQGKNTIGEVVGVWDLNPEAEL